LNVKISVQVEDIEGLDRVSQVECHRIRFGSEFCEWKTPNLDELRKAHTTVMDSGRSFTYITSRVSNLSLNKIDEQLAFLDGEGNSDVVVNDLGVLDLVAKHSNLRSCLGRQLVSMPARCPWQRITPTEVGFLAKRRVEKIFHQTGLNYPLTTRFFQDLGVKNVDVDWIPSCFPYFEQLITQGFNLSVHLYHVLVAATRKCHTARFLGEAEPEECSRPCRDRSFRLKQRALGVEFYLKGNAIFRYIEPTERDFKRLNRKEVELVLSIDPTTKLDSPKRINGFINDLPR